MGGILHFEQRGWEAAKIVDGFELRRCVHGRAQTLPVGGDHQDGLGSLRQEGRQALQEIPRFRLFEGKHGRAV